MIRVLRTSVRRLQFGGRCVTGALWLVIGIVCGAIGGSRVRDDVIRDVECWVSLVTSDHMERQISEGWGAADHILSLSHPASCLPTLTFSAYSRDSITPLEFVRFCVFQRGSPRLDVALVRPAGADFAVGYWRQTSGETGRVIYLDVPPSFDP